MIKAKKFKYDQVEIYGDGNQRRELMHIRDFVDAMFFLDNIEILPTNIFNVGVGYDFSIRQIAEAIKEGIGYKGKLHFNPDAPVGMKTKLMDSMPLRMMGYQSNHSTLEELVKFASGYK